MSFFHFLMFSKKIYNYEIVYLKFSAKCYKIIKLTHHYILQSREEQKQVFACSKKCPKLVIGQQSLIAIISYLYQSLLYHKIMSNFLLLDVNGKSHLLYCKIFSSMKYSLIFSDRTIHIPPPSQHYSRSSRCECQLAFDAARGPSVHSMGRQAGKAFVNLMELSLFLSPLCYQLDMFGLQICYYLPLLYTISLICLVMNLLKDY